MGTHFLIVAADRITDTRFPSPNDGGRPVSKIRMASSSIVPYTMAPETWQLASPVTNMNLLHSGVTTRREHSTHSVVSSH